MNLCTPEQYYLSHNFSDAERLEAKSGARKFARAQMPEILKEAWNQTKTKMSGMLSGIMEIIAPDSSTEDKKDSPAVSMDESAQQPLSPMMPDSTRKHVQNEN